MSSENEDGSLKTEDPSNKKLEEALTQGQVIFSREVNNFVILFLLTLLVICVMPFLIKSFGIYLRFFIENAGNIPADEGMIAIVFSKIMNKSMIYFSPLFVATIIAALASYYLQVGRFIFTGEQIMPKLSRISLMSGFGRLFSRKNLVELFKSCCKLLFIGIFLVLVIKADIPWLPIAQDMSISGILGKLSDMINHMLICTSVLLLIIALADYFYQRFEYYQSLRMTKQELKEEYKQTEGNPEIKSKIRSLRRQQAERVLKNTVPKATVVITNPEHYAVALEYDIKVNQPPIVVAKGLDFVAQKIKEIAEEHRIPIVENPPLARLLYKEVELKKEINVEHYEAVAKVIGYVMSLKERKKRG